MRRLDATTLVASQIQPGEVAGLGVRMLVNNRPDGEEPGQPSSAEMESAARAAGIAYCHIPIAGGFSEADVEAMARALDQGPALAFCRSGTRSTYLWALARASRGETPEALAARAEAAGYDLSPIQAILAGLRAP